MHGENDMYDNVPIVPVQTALTLTLSANAIKSVTIHFFFRKFQVIINQTAYNTHFMLFINKNFLIYFN